MVLAALALSILIGLALGMLGGGGSILGVPILRYVAGFTAAQAITGSLFVVAVTSGVGAVAHARAGRVRWRTGLVFGSAGMLGAFAGGNLSAQVPGEVLMTLFAVVMLATAIAMLRGRRAGAATARELPVAKALAVGVGFGVLTGVLGAGGGFLVVPALVLLGGLAMDAAVGTSLLVIVLNSLAGLVGHLHHVALDWELTLGVTAVAVGGALIGGRLAGRVRPELLRRLFGGFLIVIATAMLIAQLA